MYTLKGAKKFLETHTVDEWLHMYLKDSGNNSRLSWELNNMKTYSIGLKEIHLSDIIKTRDGDSLKYKEDKKLWENKVRELKKHFDAGGCFGPIIVNYKNGKYFIFDGNHRHQVLLENKIETYPCIVVYNRFKDLLNDNKYDKKIFFYSIEEDTIGSDRQSSLFEVLFRDEFGGFLTKKVSSSDEISDAFIKRKNKKTKGFIFLSEKKDIYNKLGNLPYPIVALNIKSKDFKKGYDLVDKIIDHFLKNLLSVN